MNLSKKVAASVVGVFAVFALTSLLVQRGVVLPSFERLERDAALTDMQRMQGAVNRELMELETMAGDWGNWSDSYAFAADRNRRFADVNLTQAAFDAVHLDLIVVVAPDGELVWKTGRDPDSRLPRRYAQVAGTRLDPAHPLRQPIAAGTRAAGMLWTEAGPMLLAVAPILDGHGSGPHRGAVMFGRVLNEAVVARLALQTQLKLSATTLPRGANRAAPLEGVHIARRDQVNLVAQDMDDLYGRPLVRFEIESPRAISAIGRDAANLGFAMLLVAGITMLLVLYHAMRVMVLHPIGRIEQFSRDLAASDDLSGQLLMSRQDEIGRLADQLNLMVQRLAEARRAVADVSFDAGLAEMARGVLHNVGNALTPALVGTGTLQQELRRLPLADLELVCTELARPDLDAARRTDLLRFLKLATTELQERLEAVTTHSRDLADGLFAIQAILHEQSRFARTALVVERVAADELVAKALRMVAPAKLARLQIDADASLAAAGAQRMPRIAMEQVVQNMVVNAAEAVPAQQPSGRLRISASHESRAGRPYLCLRFADDGTGIQPEHLAQLFRKRFSTKSADSNSGLGLHWCANVVAGIGGSIEAASPGPGMGATFTILLPADRDQADSLLEDIAA